MDPELQAKAVQVYRDAIAMGVDPEQATRVARMFMEREGPNVGALESVGRGLAQGVSFGFADEASAALKALPRLAPGGQSFSESFSENVEESRSRDEAARAQRPFLTGASEFAGFAVPAAASVLLSGGSATPAVGARTGAMLARPVAGAAIEGGLSAAGHSEGNVLERLDDAAVGAAAGAALGGVGSRIIKAGPRVTGAVLGGATGAALDDSGTPVEGGLAGAAAGGLGGAGVSRGARRVLDRVAGPGSNILPTAQERAANKVSEALRREGIDLSDVSPTPGQTVLDAGDPRGPVARLARAVEAVPSRGGSEIREFVESRAETAPTRIRQALQRDSGLTFEDAFETADDLARVKRQNAQPLYERAYEQSVPVDVIATELRDIPAFQQAYSRGINIARVEGVEIPEQVGVEVPIQAIDYMKRGLDDVISSRMRSGGMGANEARVLRGRLNDVLERVDEIVPDYATARATYAGDSAVQQAFEEGRDTFLRSDPREIARRLVDMQPSEAEFYRRGALDAVRSRLERSADNRDLSSVVAGNSEMRARIRNIFASDDDFNRFLESMRVERANRDRGNFITGGSPTARIQSDVDDLNSGSLSDILSPSEFLRTALRSTAANRLRGFDEATSDAIAPLLTRPLTGGNEDILGELLRAHATRQLREQALGTIPTALAGSVGGSLGSR